MRTPDGKMRLTDIVYEGGSVAGNARREIESKTGEKAVVGRRGGKKLR